MSADTWSRHVALARFYLQLLDLHVFADPSVASATERAERPPTLISGSNTASAIERRGEYPPTIFPKLEQVIGAMEQGRDIITGQRGMFREAYISEADDSAQPYSLYVPDDYDAGKAWPLIVYLHGRGGTSGETAFPLPLRPRNYLFARCDGRSGSTWDNLAERDILDVMAHVQKFYHVDPSRIYIMGGSMGGAGTWSMATAYPDLFAAALPICGFPVTYLENLHNVPVWVFHDRDDQSVAVQLGYWSVRRLQRLGSPARFFTAEGYGHDGFEWARLAGADYTTWLLDQRKPDAPPTIFYRTMSAKRPRAYWVEILQFSDPTREASVAARALTGNQLYLEMENVETLAVKLPAQLFDRQRALDVAVGNDMVRQEAPLPEVLYVNHTADGVRVVATDPRTPQEYRRYDRGSLSNLYGGEPLLIVQGTSGGPALAEAMAAFAREMACHNVPSQTMDFATIPIKLDRDVTEEDLLQKHLVLIGGPEENSVTRMIATGLPVVEKNGQVSLAGIGTYDLANRGYTVYHYNPVAPQRLVFVVASKDAKFYTMQNGVVNNVFSGELPLDFVLCDVEQKRIVRQVSWDRDWHPHARFANSPVLPASFEKEENVLRETAISWRRVANADVVVWPYVNADIRARLAFDTRTATWADFEAGCREWKVFAADVSGEQLLKVMQAARTSTSFSLETSLDESTIDPNRQYRIATSDRNIASIKELMYDYVTNRWLDDLKRRLCGEP
jgi:pimeloyl-ACP methyl ester carboxylesterase